MDLDCKLNRPKDPHKVLAQHKRTKKKKYLYTCTEQQRYYFTPFTISTDDVIGKEARALLRQLSALLADKWDQPYSVACGYVNAQMSIAIMRATHLCLQGSHIPTGQMSNQYPQWEDSASLSLFQDLTPSSSPTFDGLIYTPLSTGTAPPLNNSEHTQCSAHTTLVAEQRLCKVPPRYTD
jgi:hypothetical protein